MLKNFFMFMFLTNLLTVPAFASGVMSAGTVLEQDSYVFSIEEAQELKNKMEKLESLVTEYKKLDEVFKQKEAELHNIISLKEQERDVYKELYLTGNEKVLRLERKRTIEQIGMVSAGAVVTIGLILVADAIDDHIDVTGPATSSQAQRSVLRVKF